MPLVASWSPVPVRATRHSHSMPPPQPAIRRRRLPARLLITIYRRHRSPPLLVACHSQPPLVPFPQSKAAALLLPTLPIARPPLPPARLFFAIATARHPPPAHHLPPASRSTPLTHVMIRIWCIKEDFTYAMDDEA
ncbi:uncharacterized protein LOC110027279 [Phalaenopsis equestris]|uniref:uncharacterized protein LOC110027279 n=1 Tax=Phalaenopsis equestris TaxID=78828 RepID=UPI0009E3F9E3|nr:uncharacterized protein LOC110027279 [Phalaenopsis equestris]